METCPSCGRALATARPTCLYCGAPPPSAAAGTRPAKTAPRVASDRVLLILDLDGADPERVGEALRLSRFEADQRVRRGGYQLHRILDADAAPREADRLAAIGLRVTRLAGAETRDAARPVVAIGGRLAGRALDLRTTEGDLRVDGADLRLVVRGPILRERQTLRGQEKSLVRRMTRQWDESLTDTAYRLHLHRNSHVRPVELNPDAFEFAERALEAGLVQMTRWVRALAPDVPVDEGFKWAPPALGPAESTAPGVLGSADALTDAARRQRKGRTVLLDNLAQFRFYSAWRGALGRGR